MYNGANELTRRHDAAEAWTSGTMAYKRTSDSYVTYALAREAGLPAEDAEKLAWADQYTDDLTEPDLHGIQTQCATVGNWADRQVQLSVLVPFHFVPGADATHPWMTTAGSDRASCAGLTQ
jgi:hypothetical protein